MFAALMAATTRILETGRNDGSGLHPFQILFARMSITALLSSIYMWMSKVPHFPFGEKGIRWLLVARSAGGFFGVFGLYYSLVYLPLAEATVITFMSPMLTCWACSLLLHEPFSRKEQLAALVSIFGVLLIAKPDSLFSGPGEPPSSSPDVGTIRRQDSPAEAAPVSSAQRIGAVAVALLGVVGSACAYTSIRWIGNRAHPLISVNWYAAVCTIISTFSLLLIPSIGFELPANLKEWALLLFLGTCGFLLQFMLTAGLQDDNSSRATNMMYFQMVFALGLDKLIWGTIPGWVSIVGGALILGSTIFVAVRTNSNKPVAQKPETSDEEFGLVRAFDEDDSDDPDMSPAQGETGTPLQRLRSR
ncbi:MAG: hypothetical protein M4579_000662 [Chaenotheca gracillima]|nr:MAG: hypothetical protein M4579_000662 [Chaenotheca gracillima]